MKRLWNVPPRNPFFTGREDVLDALHKHLQKGAAAWSQPPAVSGLGGIGKTQTAIEYAYRHRDEYAAVLWVGAETETDILSGFTELARLLELPERDDTEQAQVITTVQRWLASQENWLLILDNADDLSLTQNFLPREHHGHVIYTTRSAVVGRIARLITVKKFSPEQGAYLLLQRATGEEPSRDTPEWKAALEISTIVDGLPLALEQAGAYMEENRRSANEYLHLYENAGVKLLKKHSPSDHASVTVTFSLAFKELVKQNTAAADLLRLCSFLSPDSIPEDLFTSNVEILEGALKITASQLLEWPELIGQICRGSLLTRNPVDRSLTIHRIVQDVLREDMSAEEQTLYVNSAVELLYQSLPTIEINNWPLFEQLSPHILLILQRVEELDIFILKIATMANRIGSYLEARARYTAAEQLFERALKMSELQQGDDHLSTATSLNNLAGLYESQGRYKEAEPLYERALEIRESQLGTDHFSTATSLNDLANLYKSQGRYEPAELLFKRALEVFESQLGTDHPFTATTLNNLAHVYISQTRYKLVEPLLERALNIRESQLGTNHLETATSLSNLASFYLSQYRDEEAEPLYKRALKIREMQLGLEHPKTAISLNGLAQLYESRGRYDEAEPIYKQSLSILEKRLGLDHPHTVIARENYQDLLSKLQNPQ